MIPVEPFLCKNSTVSEPENVEELLGGAFKNITVTRNSGARAWGFGIINTVLQTPSLLWKPLGI